MALRSTKLRRSGFTLVELLVVIGIIALLVSMLLPALNKALAHSRSVKCAANLKQIGLAFQMYRNAYNNYLPPVNAYASHMAIRSDGTPSDWALSKNYGMFNALGEYLNLPQWGGVMSTTGVSPAPADDAFTGYIKSDSYWGPKAGGGKRLRKSVFLCPELLSYPDDMIGTWAGSSYGESTYLQKYPSGPNVKVPAWNGDPGQTSSAYGFPRPASKIKNPSISIAVSEKGGDNHSGSPKFLPDIAKVTKALYPPRNTGSPYDDWDMYRHYGGCNILFADGHVMYHKGLEILNRIVKDADSKSMRNYNLP
jgi:prepilin-type processing-associated H-X9-DG protein/prepilin-type N-terminal cleavage/methylation domain-containing protein